LRRLAIAVSQSSTRTATLAVRHQSNDRGLGQPVTLHLAVLIARECRDFLTAASGTAAKSGCHDAVMLRRTLKPNALKKRVTGADSTYLPCSVVG